ncbi:MAG: PQQ-dependent dehydrogenase, methanol/ethanol family [Hyphomonadaceae bacterium]|nr:PQQ-dependent dehydrogenase, methanol/ethanol family [Hyphomonadaceae bacterium]
MRALLLSLAVAAPAFLTSCTNNVPSAPVDTAAPAPTYPTGSAAVNNERLIAADREPGSWLATGLNYHEDRFSRLDQVNDANVKQLGLAWYADIDTERGQESTPIIVDGVMYLTTAWSMVKAYDIRSGAKLWEYDPNVAKAKAADACCDVVNRGVAAWNGKIYLGALDGRLIALDGKTGKEVWSVQTTDTNLPYTITGVPRIVKGKVIIGNGGAEYRVRGYVTAYDAETGKEAWRWWTVPGDPSKPYEQPELAEAAKGWKGDNYWKIGGGGTAWDGMAYDPELDTIYVGTGNGNPWNQAIRSPGGGDNLFLSSIVALDPNTGKYKWHYQTTPGETWDYTAVQPLIIADLNYPEGKRRVVMQAPKNGFFYVLDAKTGELLSAEKFAPLTWATHVDMKTGRPVEIPEARYEITGKAVIVSPGALGMHNWHPMAFSPETGLVYIPVQVSAAPYVGPKEFKLNLQGTNTGTDFSGGQALCQQPGARCGNLETYILAWDPIAGKEKWRIKNEVYGSSGILATSGNLIFSGNHKGEFNAYNATTGEKLWTAPTQARVVAAPSTFLVDGQQQVAILVGARGLPNDQKRTNAISANNSRILVFKPGGAASLPAEMPAATAAARVKIDPPLLTANNETVFAGEQAYAANCASCHGPTAVPGAGSIAPDLRYSGLLPIRNGWNPTVRDGDRATRGMPGFAATLSQETTDAILAYVIKRANDEKAAQEAAAKPN